MKKELKMSFHSTTAKSYIKTHQNAISIYREDSIFIPSSWTEYPTLKNMCELQYIYEQLCTKGVTAYLIETSFENGVYTQTQIFMITTHVNKTICVHRYIKAEERYTELFDIVDVKNFIENDLLNEMYNRKIEE